MKRSVVLSVVVLVVLLAAGRASGHLCDNVWRQANKLIIKPEVTSLVIKDKATFKVYLQSNMDANPIAKNVRLVGTSEAFDIRVEPADGHRIKHGVRYTYEVTLSLKPAFRSGDHPIHFDAMVEDLTGKPRLMRSYTLGIAAKKGKTEVRLSEKAPIFAGEAPKIDGLLTEECWKNALLLQTTSNTQGGKSALRTIALLTSDGKDIYVAMSAAGEQPKSKVSPNPQDSVSVLFAPPAAKGKEAVRFKVTAAGDVVLYSVRGGRQIKMTKTAVAKTGLQAAVTKSETAWYAELRIPVTFLGVSRTIEGMKWRVNIVRENVENPVETSFWSGTSENYLKVQGFGDVAFSRWASCSV